MSQQPPSPRRLESERRYWGIIDKPSNEEKKLDWGWKFDPNLLAVTPMESVSKLVTNPSPTDKPKQVWSALTIEQMREAEKMYADLVKSNGGVQADDQPPCGDSCGS
jgi:hypothetical protein